MNESDLVAHSSQTSAWRSQELGGGAPERDKGWSHLRHQTGLSVPATICTRRELADLLPLPVQCVNVCSIVLVQFHRISALLGLAFGRL